MDAVRLGAVGNAGGLPPGVLILRHELVTRSMRPLGSLWLGERTIDLAAGHDALWAIVRRPQKGGLAIRIAFNPAGTRGAKRIRRAKGEAARLSLEGPLGSHVVSVRLIEDAIPQLRVTTAITPATPLLTSFFPRDLYPLDTHDDPAGARGTVEAAQRGLNTGAIYLRLEEPAFGSILYLQDLTRLNDYFRETGTKPDGAVGGEWPELGYLLPTPPQEGTPPLDPLPAGRETIISDALIAFHDDADGDEQAVARRYLSLLGAVARQVVQPETEYRDWPARAGKSLADLANSAKASVRCYGHRYIRPYTDGEVPDSMVQLTVLASIRDFEVWSGEKVDLGAELAAGLGKFYDSHLGTLRRYLPNVGREKDRDAVDSWYLYHPLMQLGRLAVDGDRQARRLFLNSLPFAIKAARHFTYKWPIQYKITDFSIITEARNDDGLGQTDVGGLYAYVMLQAFELTDDKSYLDEARAAIDAAKGMRFELNYQANLTAWGASACMRLWRITDDRSYLAQSYVYLASFFHNTAMWESEIGHARYYRNFLGATALHDAPYMALYECFDSFAAFERYLKDSGPELDPAARWLISEYCRHALDRAWFYYPDALPPDAIADTQREGNGHIDRTLSFPVEDLYVDGQPAGQVGQEIYGVGAAMVFASRAFHPIEGAPFTIFCDHFLLAMERPTTRSLSAQLSGPPVSEAKLILIRKPHARLPRVVVSDADASPIRARYRAPDRVEYRVPADGRIAIRW